MVKLIKILSISSLLLASASFMVNANASDLEELVKKAESGQAEAQTALGIKYAEGDGVDKDFDKARKWFERAGNNNYADAEYNLSVMYRNGDGVAKDINRALFWLKKAANHGHSAARYNLGIIYSSGLGVEKDLVQAEHWFSLVGKDGTADDQYALGAMYSEGEYVPKDDVKARSWFEKAAAEGHMLAQYNLAIMSSEGIGGKKDLTDALNWAEQAAKQGDAQAAQLLATLKNDTEIHRMASVEKFLLYGLQGEEPQITPPERLRSSSVSPSESTKNDPPETPQNDISAATEEPVSTDINQDSEDAKPKPEADLVPDAIEPSALQNEINADSTLPPEDHEAQVSVSPAPLVANDAEEPAADQHEAAHAEKGIASEQKDACISPSESNKSITSAAESDSNTPKPAENNDDKSQLLKEVLSAPIDSVQDPVSP